MKLLKGLRAIPFWAVLLIAAAATATYADFLKNLALRESGNRPGAKNSYGYVGLFQMGEAALKDAGYYGGDGTAKNDWSGGWTGKDGVTSLSGFMSDPQAQVNAITKYHAMIQSYISSNGLMSYVGTTVGGTTVTLSGMIAGAHLVGMGNLKTWLTSGGTLVPKDGNGVPITSYVRSFGGYAVSTTAPTYWGAGGGVAPAPTPAPSPGGVAGPAASTFVSADSAFTATSAATMDDVRRMIGGVFAALLFVWAAWTVFQSYRTMNKGHTQFIVLQRDAVGVLVLISVGVWLVS